MADSPLLDGLPVEQRLALAYAPARSRDLFAAVFALDTRLAGIVRAAREPILAQLRLAWWRDRIEQGGGTADPVLAAVAPLRTNAAGLVALVNGWEALLGETFDTATVESFAGGRVLAMEAVAQACDAESPAAARAARAWALADLAGHVTNPQEQAVVLELAAAHDWQRAVLPRALRPLAVLGGLARRRRGAGGLIAGPASLLSAIRLGLTGR